MKQYAHISFSLGLGSLLTATFNLVETLGFLFFFIIMVTYLAGKINDWLDHEMYLKHERKFLTHSPLSPLLILLALSTGAPFSLLSPFLGIYVFFLIYVIFLSHIFLDAMNSSGVPILPNKKIRIAQIPYDDLTANLTCVFIGTFMILIGLLMFFST